MCSKLAPLFFLAICSCAGFEQIKSDLAKLGSNSSSSATAAEGAWTKGDVEPDPFTAKCVLFKHHDDYAGFSIGHPQGWLIDYSTDTIIVSKDEKQLVGALVFPARLKKESIPAERVATVFAEDLRRYIVSHGGKAQLTEQKTDGKVATATMLATIDGVELKGPMRVVETPGFVTLKLYWAPKDELAAEAPTLKQVLSCYERQTLITARNPVTPPGGRVTKVGYPPAKTHAGTATTSSAAPVAVHALDLHRGKFIDISMPAGWVVADELENGIDVTSADKSMGAGFGWILNPVRGQDPMSMVRQSIARFHPEATVRRIEYEKAPQGWVAAVGEWEGPLMHGIDRATMGQGIATTAGWSAPKEKWAALAPTLEAVASSAQITPAAAAKVRADVRAQLASYPKPTPSRAPTASSSSSSPMSSASQDRRNQDFDDYIRGDERATNSAGQELVVPTSMWNATGPQGPGYYQATPGGGAELLTPVPPPSE